VKRLFVLLVVVALGVPCSLAAASVIGAVSAGKVASDVATISACDIDGFTISYTTVGGNVTSVTVGGIDSRCNGGTLKLAVVDSSRTSVASGGPVTVSGSSATVSVSPNPAGSVPGGVDVAISGP
jgi:hypothetical protein